MYSASSQRNDTSDRNQLMMRDMFGGADSIAADGAPGVRHRSAMTAALRWYPVCCITYLAGVDRQFPGSPLRPVVACSSGA